MAVVVGAMVVTTAVVVGAAVVVGGGDEAACAGVPMMLTSGDVHLLGKDTETRTPPNITARTISRRVRPRDVSF